MNTTAAPDFTPGYPSKGKKLGPAWQALWDKLTIARQNTDQYIDGHVLADEIGPDYGLEPASVVVLLSRAAKHGVLERDHRDVLTHRGKRTRTHYRIPASHE